MAENFHLAPPPKTVDGLTAVPIDIQSIDAKFTFDGSTQTGVADSTFIYTVGPEAGNPIFDLRQTIAEAWLDGVPIAPEKLAHHSFGTGPFTDLRVVESAQTPGSVHSLRLTYALALPNSQLGGSYLPAMEWSSGPKLRFALGFSDLNRARYAEAWIPANLIFDQFALTLEVEITNTVAPHSVITNGDLIELGTNHWRIEFPARMSALSPLLEIHASDQVSLQTDTVVLPVSGKAVTVEAWKPAGSSVDLDTQLQNIKALLSTNETDFGPYVHDGRFVAFFNGAGGMEYDGGTTTSPGALGHETFHSWFARGIKPASQSDGWWDEGFTTFHDAGANDAEPFDFSDPPVLLCSRDPWQRHTPTNSYSDGARFWRGAASLLGVANLRTRMKDLYSKQRGNPVSTAMIEESLLSTTGNAHVVDAFHRFVYGFDDPVPAPDLWIKDASPHTGADHWNGVFWNSPDLWVRNRDDDGSEHQAPEYGQDNWFYARIRNRSSEAPSEHFAVTFHTKGFAGTQFNYPDDFLPCTVATAGFELPPGGVRVVKARWPRETVPPAGSHTCLLASVITRSDHPASGAHVWEHNNLAQKNLTIVDLWPNSYVIVPVVLRNHMAAFGSRFSLEILRDRSSAQFVPSFLHHNREFFDRDQVTVHSFTPLSDRSIPSPHIIPLDCGGRIPRTTEQRNRILTSERPDLVYARFPQSFEAFFPEHRPERLTTALPTFSQAVLGLKVGVPRSAEPGQIIRLHLVQRSSDTGTLVGGVAVQINVHDPKSRQVHRR